MAQIASAYKVTNHRDKLESYLRGERIYPATLELDITTECTMDCKDCPGSRGHSHTYVDMEFVEKLFRSLGGHTKGLLIAGGEPTMSGDFPEILALARECGFEEISVVSNGTLLHRDRVANALMEHATSLRVSLYGWGRDSCLGIKGVMDRVSELRAAVDASGSDLHIGVSALTNHERIVSFETIVDAVRDAGAHWLYFHPMCTGWGEGCPSRVNQDGVSDAIEKYVRRPQNGFKVYVGKQRYANRELKFDSYHAAHFLLVIGADGINYVGAESKYQPHLVLCDVAGKWSPNFLWQEERLQRIQTMSSKTYPGIHSRHRGLLYNDVIHSLKEDPAALENGVWPIPEESYRYPHVL